MLHRPRRFSLPLVLIVCAFAVTLSAAENNPVASSPQSGVHITPLADRLRVDLNGRLFTEYYFKDVPRPYCYPLMGPGELPLTRNWPMKSTPNEEHDHPHHRSLWFTHGSVNGLDFWSEQKDSGKIVHMGFTGIRSGQDVGLIQSTNQWISAGGAIVCTDLRRLQIYAPARPNECLVDFEVTIFASHGDLTFGDTKEGSMGVRLAETMRLKGKVGHGHIVNSAGDRDDRTWGKRADWCDYYGPVAGQTVGIAIFDHPQNPRHPTWWHVRDYGLFAANPFGQHDFERLSNKTAGNLTVPAGKSVTFRYRFYLHRGDPQAAKVAEYYQQYVTPRD